jgi:hypothetical protein
LTQHQGGASEPPQGRQQELESEVEGLVERIIDVVNAAEPEHRHSLREYAADLLKGGTEVVVEPDGEPEAASRERSSSPLGIAALLLVFSFPMGLLFPLMGITMFAIALALGLLGAVLMVTRR